MTVSQQSKRTDEEWNQLIEECRSSNLSNKAWCEEHHIQISNFYYHLRRLRKKTCQSFDKTPGLSSHSSGQDIIALNFDDSTEEKTTHYHSDDSFRSVIRISINGIQIDISNSATKDVLTETLHVLRHLC